MNPMLRLRHFASSPSELGRFGAVAYVPELVVVEPAHGLAAHLDRAAAG